MLARPTNHKDATAMRAALADIEQLSAEVCRAIDNLARVAAATSPNVVERRRASDWDGSAKDPARGLTSKAA
jgi:hypothetical protein